MVGADSIIKVVAAPIAVFAIIVVTGIGFQLMDPIYNTVFDHSLMAELGWGSPQDTVMRFAGLGFIGLILVVILWLVSSPIRKDQRQDQRPPRGPL